MHDYAYIHHQPDWLLRQFDKWAICESRQETTACAKRRRQYSFQSEEIWYHIKPGGRLNKKGLTRYGDSHVKDKTS